MTLIPRDPTFRALASATLLIALWFVWGPIPQRQPPRVTTLRLGWKRCADIVVVGDSTVAWTVHPEVIEDELAGGYRVANFGFVSIPLGDRAYLSAAEAVLDSATPHRTVVLALNFSNTRRVVRGNGFTREKKLLEELQADGRPPSLELDWHDQLDLRLHPRGLCGSLWNACPWGSQLLVGYNGQLTTTQYPYDETRLVPSVVDQNHGRPPLYDPDALQESLFHWIATLRASGVDVVAYVESDRPAIAPLTAAAGYDRSRLARELRAAGAAVIDFPSDLTTMNGIHLDPPSALRWSSALGKALAARLPARAATTVASERCAWPLQSKDHR